MIQKVKAGINGLDGIMYDDFADKILTINHSQAGRNRDRDRREDWQCGRQGHAERHRA